MPAGKKTRILVGALAAAALVLVGGYGAARALRGQSRAGDVLPAFTELPPGPRAPSTNAFGIAVVGKTRLSEVEKRAREMRIECHDTSVRALMRRAREEKKKEIEAKRARGENVDGMSAATGKSPKERNPQVRLSCEGVGSSLLSDRARPPSEGRLLFVFDSDAHPLRHVSYRRKHKDPARALDELEGAIAAMRERYGEPSQQTGELPARGPGGEVEFPLLVPLKRVWSFADLKVEVSALHFGKRGIDILEAVEVPWPVRADAPALR